MSWLMSRLVMQLLLLAEYGTCGPIIMHQDKRGRVVIPLVIHYKLPVTSPSN